MEGTELQNTYFTHPAVNQLTLAAVRPWCKSYPVSDPASCALLRMLHTASGAWPLLLLASDSVRVCGGLCLKSSKFEAADSCP